MRLITKYNRINIATTIFIFLIGSCSFYFLLRYILIHELDESLDTERQEIIQYKKEHNALPEIISTKDQHITYSPAPSLLPLRFENTIIDTKGNTEYYRQIQFGADIAGQYYLITVSKPLEETEDLLQVIIAVTIVMIALILLAGFFINRGILNRLWKPFYLTIESVKEYKLSSQEPLRLDKTGVDEFSLLNQSISNMTERVQQDYQSLKEFTGHAAHEMQTPLAIIRTKLDMLIQSENLLQQNAKNILEIEAAVQRLSRLNQSLLLLTKVENRQFVLNEQLQLDEMIRDKCAELSEMIDAKHLQINTDIEPLLISFHRHLAEIIIANLLNNAIRYNKEGGNIEIALRNGVFSISNTSDLTGLDKEKVFQRFYRHTDSWNEGNGLGLSIVKQVCELAGFSIDYQYLEGRHMFKIIFKRK